MLQAEGTREARAGDSLLPGLFTQPQAGRNSHLGKVSPLQSLNLPSRVVEVTTCPQVFRDTSAETRVRGNKSWSAIGSSWTGHSLPSGQRQHGGTRQGL